MHYWVSSKSHIVDLFIFFNVDYQYVTKNKLVVITFIFKLVLYLHPQHETQLLNYEKT